MKSPISVIRISPSHIERVPQISAVIVPFQKICTPGSWSCGIWCCVFTNFTKNISKSLWLTSFLSRRKCWQYCDIIFCWKNAFQVRIYHNNPFKLVFYFYAPWERQKTNTMQNTVISTITIPKLCLTTKFPLQEIRWKYSILRSVTFSWEIEIEH